MSKTDTQKLTLTKPGEDKCLPFIVRRSKTSLPWWAGAVAMASITLATVVGNSAVLVALCRLRRAPAHYPLASLAAADLLVGLCVLPVAAARELFVFHLNWILCSCWSTLDVLCCTASILSICLLGWERWRGITAPLSRASRAERAKLYAVLVWPTAAAVALPTAFVPSHVHYLPGERPKACSVNTNVGYVFVSIFFSFYLPACLMLAMYVLILRALAAPPSMLIRAHRGRTPCTDKPCPSRETTKAAFGPPSSFREKVQKVTVFLSPKGQHLFMPGTDAKPSQPKSQKNSEPPFCLHSRQQRATRTIVMLMSLFLFCWTPFFIMLPVDSLCECVWEVAWQWCSWLGYANSALNPLVYAAASPSVRRALHASFSSTSTKTDIPLTPVRRT